MESAYVTSIGSWEGFRLELIKILFKISIRTAQKTYCVSITNTKQLTLFRDIIAVYCDNCTKHINTRDEQNADPFSVKATGTHSCHCVLQTFKADGKVFLCLRRDKAVIMFT
jgi:hypothetical protein